MKRLLNREFFLMLASIALSAGWATRLGTLPGQGRPVLGPLVEGLLWASLYAGLSLVYLAAAPVTPHRRVPRMIGLCLLLALLSAHLSNLLSAALSTSWMWGKLFYLKRLLPPAWVGFWCVVLLPRETRALVGTIRATPMIAPLPHLAVLLASASILVSCADLAFEWSGDSAVQSALKHQIITKEAWAGNVLILFSAYALAFAVTSRVLAALLLVSPWYVALGLASLVKIRYMHSAVQPLDVVRIGEFVPLVQSFFGTGVLVAAGGALGLWIAALVVAGKLQPDPVSITRRRATGLLSLAALMAVPVAYFVEPAPWLWRNSANQRSPGQELALVFSRALLGQDRDRQFRETAREAGLMKSFLSELPAAFVLTPPDYSPAAVAGSAERYCTPAIGTRRLERPAARGRRDGVNLVLYLVESLMDPADLGWRYTSDPIPNLRALRENHIGGHAIVPEEFGGSPTTEFEALTGMTTTFLPEGSVAYRLYLKHPIPSLPSTLGSLGYATTAIRADPKYFYNHETAYRLLGFDKVVWLNESPVVDRGPRGTWPTDDAVVDAVMQAAREAHPFFVLAFASSAHSPYSHGAYKDADLDVHDAPTPDVASDVKEYINALRVADRAIGRLVERLRDEPDSTILAVLGDHLPPLRDGPLQRFFVRLSSMSAPEGAWMRRRVPLLVWANFELPREEKELTTNALPSYLLEKMGIPSAGFLGVSEVVSRRLSIIRSYAKAANGTVWHWDSLPVAERRLLEDYRLLQYDLLLGKRYSLSGSVSAGRPCGSTARPQPVSRP